MFKHRLLALSFFSAIAPPGVSRAGEPLDNWPQWRGPLATGVAPKGDPPIHWDEGTNIRWKSALPGRGSATPIVWGDQIFIATAIKTDRVASASELPKIDPKLPVKTEPPSNFYQFVVLSYDRGSGKLRWRQKSPPKKSRTKDIIRLTPMPPVHRRPMADSSMSPSAPSAFFAMTSTAS